MWSAEELQAADAAPACVAIDWNTIRENKDKYEELKWKGEGSYCHYCTYTVGHKYLESDMFFIDLALLQHGFENKLTEKSVKEVMTFTFF